MTTARAIVQAARREFSAQTLAPTVSGAGPGDRECLMAIFDWRA